jgi:hypothetical protein
MTPYEMFNPTVHDQLGKLRDHVERARAASGGATSPFEYHRAVYGFALLSPVERARFLDYLEGIIKDWCSYLEYGSGRMDDLSIWVSTQISTWSEDIYETYTVNNVTL